MKNLKLMITGGCILLVVFLVAIVLAFIAAQNTPFRANTTSEVLGVNEKQELEVLLVDWEVSQVVDNMVYIYPCTGTYVVDLTAAELDFERDSMIITSPQPRIDISLNDGDRRILFQPSDWKTKSITGSAEAGIEKYMTARAVTEDTVRNDMESYEMLNEIAEDNAKNVITAFVESVSYPSSNNRKIEINFVEK